MAPFIAPDQLADRMVELLFEETRSTSSKRILYPGCGNGELIAAVDRYFEDKIKDPPDGVAIDTDERCLETVRETYGNQINVQKADYLSADDRLGHFDFVLSYPPTVEWHQLETEVQTAYANSFGQLAPDSSGIHTGLLFVERSLHVLTDDGTAVFLIPSQFKTEELKGPFRGHLAPTIADVEQVDDDAFESEIPHMFLKLNSPNATDFEPAESSYRPDPSNIEKQLLKSALPSSTTHTASQLATTYPELKIYSAEDDSGYVYLDLYYEDYDAALVYEDPNQREGLCGYVSRATMEIQGEESVSAHVTSLTQSDCIAPDATIGATIDRLGRDGERFFFLGDAANPTGIITRFDLNKMPVYQYLYILLARFEIRLRELIREHVKDWESETDVTIRSLHVGELAPDKLAGGTLGNLLDILSETNSTHLVHPNLDSYDADLDDLKDLRDAIAHYNPIVHYMNNDVDSTWTAGELRDQHRLLQDLTSSSA